MTIADRVAREIARDDARRQALGDSTNIRVTFKTRGVARAWSVVVAVPATVKPERRNLVAVRHAAHGVWPTGPVVPTSRTDTYMVNVTTVATTEQV